MARQPSGSAGEAAVGEAPGFYGGPAETLAEVSTSSCWALAHGVGQQDRLHSILRDSVQDRGQQ